MATVLIADDSKFQVQLLSSYLSDQGYEVLTAMDAMQGSMAAMRHSPDAIVLDINMPGGTGFEVLKRLKNSTKTQHIPVVIVSGSEMDPEAAKRIGAAAYLHKPIDAAQLCDTVGKLISEKRPRKRN
ncbi:MAG TPA: response regulator [Terriglobales bacterium]|nr:response regulator [Terriglobales bacterium]